jgi:hypothetical protein
VFRPGNQQAVVDEAIEVVGGERAADAGGAGRFLAADPTTAVRDEVVERSSHRIVQRPDERDRGVRRLLPHDLILKQIRIDMEGADVLKLTFT